MARRWKILDRGDVGEHDGHDIEYTCARCGKDALLTVVGLPIAQTGAMVVFDVGRHAMPAAIRCPHCRRSFEAA